MLACCARETTVVPIPFGETQILFVSLFLFLFGHQLPFIPKREIS